MADDLSAIFRRLVNAASGLPEVEQSTWYGTPALKVRGKGFCRMKDAGTVAILAAEGAQNARPQALTKGRPRLCSRHFEPDRPRWAGSVPSPA